MKVFSVPTCTHSRQFLRMNVIAFETCWVIKNFHKLTSSWFNLFNQQDDARSNKHKRRRVFTSRYVLNTHTQCVSTGHAMQTLTTTNATKPLVRRLQGGFPLVRTVGMLATWQSGKYFFHSVQIVHPTSAGPLNFRTAEQLNMTRLARAVLHVVPDRLASTLAAWHTQRISLTISLLLFRRIKCCLSL